MSEFDSRPETYEHIGVVRQYLTKAVVDLLERANNHDATKLTPPELETFDEFTPRLKTTKFGSEDYKNNLVQMGPALEHHYAENRHHPQHFPDGVYGMNLFDLVEMICDWLASTQRNEDGNIFRSVEINQDRFGYDDQLKAIFLNTVLALEEIEGCIDLRERIREGVAQHIRQEDTAFGVPVK